MLKTCPECELPVSDKALSCPHCGYPLQNIPKRRRQPKRMRLPNGFGQISEIKGKHLRKPFRAMVSVGKKENGRPIVRPLKPESYFPTYNDAYAALVEYNRNPYDLNPEMTVQQLYEKWTEEYFVRIQQSSSRTITAAWAYCDSVKNMRAKDLRARHIKGIMENGTANINGEIRKPSPGIKSRIKSLFNLMYDYALEYEIVEKNYARTFKIDGDITKDIEKQRRGHLIFSPKEMQTLWQNIEFPYVDVVLIQCYSGWRPQELGLLRMENIDLENWTFTGGMKTEAGTNRIVPIHTAIRPIVLEKYSEAKRLGSEYLINCTDGKTHTDNKRFTYDKYQKRFAKIREVLHLNENHRPHDGRMHFVTACKNCGVDEYAIKYMVGHTITDITEKVYTKRDIEWLAEEIEKIKGPA